MIDSIQDNKDMMSIYPEYYNDSTGGHDVSHREYGKIIGGHKKNDTSNV